MHKVWRTLAMALGFGVVTQALFWDAPFGSNVVLFALIAIGSNHALRRSSRIGIGLSALAVVAAGSIAVRASAWALVLGLPSAIAIGIAIVAAPSSVADIPWAIGRLFRGLPGGTAEAARTIPAAVGNDARPFVVRGLLGVGLGVPIAGIATLTLASCAQRLFIYEDAYGATYRRLGVLVVGLVVLAVVAATIIKCARRGWNGWGGTAITGILGVLSIASVYDADQHIARRNLDRFAAGKTLDADYLAELGPDACTLVDHPALQNSPEIRQRLHDSWAAHDGDWRSRRGVTRCR